MASLDSAINVGFPAITSTFALELTSIQWVVVGYVLPHASLLLGCGGLADLWGHSRLLICGLIVSAAAFVGCGLAPSFTWLVGARIAQGLGAALIFGTAPALVTLAVSAEHRGRALGVYHMSAALGYAFGPFLGGALVDIFGWRATFLFRTPPALLLAWLAAVKLTSLRPPKKEQCFDFLGALTLAASIAGCLLTLSRSRALGWSSPQVLILCSVSVACFIGFVFAERRASAPVIDLTLFRRPPFLIANLIAVCANCARFSIGLLLPYYLIVVLHYPATTAGSLMLAAYLLTILAAPLAGKLSDRIGTARLSSFGLAVEGVGLWLLGRLDGHSDYPGLALALGIVGLGLGIFEAPNTSFIMGAIPRERQGVASGIASMMRPLGIVLGATGWSVVFDHRRAFHVAQAAPGAPTDFLMVPALQDVFLSAAGLCAFALLLSLCRRQDSSKPNCAAN